MIKFSNYIKINEDLNNLHFEEAFKISYEKEIDPFPMEVAIWYTNEDVCFSLGVTENMLSFTEKETGDTVSWPNIRQTVYDYMTSNNLHNFTNKLLYVTIEGMKEFVKKAGKNVQFINGNNIEECSHVLYNTTVKDLQYLSMLLENTMVNFYKKYKYEE